MIARVSVVKMVKHFTEITILARSVKLQTELYILLALISFLSLMIYWRQIISGSTGPIFAIFSRNESVLSADDQSGPLFPISHGTLPWQPIWWKNGKLPHFHHSGIQKRNGILLPQCAQMMPLYHVKFSNSRVDRAHLV